MKVDEHGEHAERHLAEAQEIAHEAKSTKSMDPEKAHGIFHRLDDSLAKAAHATKAKGTGASHKIHEEIHRAREDLKEWYSKHDDEEVDHHHTFDGFHKRIDAWMEDMRESGREW